MVTNRFEHEKGQSLITVTLLLIALIGMLALVIDGGHSYLQRRAAQTAADAGALAGAQVLCETQNADSAVATALEYAIDRNHAGEANASADSDVGEVNVNTAITFQTFFGTILGRPEITAAASATAGCFRPGAAEGVLPIAYSCADGVLLDDEGNRFCDVLDYNKLYLIMMSDRLDDEECESAGGNVDCDFDNDGTDDLLFGGNRSWLDLNGEGGGASELIGWITGGYPDPISIHTWMPGQTGVETSTFKAVREIVGTECLLPVYDAMTDQGPPGPYEYHTDPVIRDEIIIGTGNDYYHIISFAIFVPTCVTTVGNEGCTLYEIGRDDHTLAPQDKTIEGYFKEGYVTGLKGKATTGLDVGTFTVFLIH